MDGTLVFKKTARGTVSFAAASTVLTPAQRAVLIMLDGQRPLDAVRKIGAVFGDCDDIVKQLLKAEMIEAVKASSAATIGGAKTTPAQMAAAKSATAKYLFNAMGADSDRLSLQIERSRSLVELTAQVGVASAVLREVKGDAIAAQFEDTFSKHLA